MTYTYKVMEEQTRRFYCNLDIKIKNIDCAISSLTMPNYADVFNASNDRKINDHRALATVGDAVCEAYLMAKKYRYTSTMKSLTKQKKLLTNNYLNNIGKDLLEYQVFAENNDCDEKNTKSYATAFEAVIGFIAINNHDDVQRILKKYLK